MFNSPELFDIREEQEKIAKIRKANLSSIIPNLFQRELTGKAIHRINPFGQASPERLKMPIEHIIPRWAMEAGNIFMGFTECGRYLLSYTVLSTESDFGGYFWNGAEDLGFEYKLHFWLFTPNTHAKKVCSVILFENYGICHDNLLIEISQWKDDPNRLLVTGRSINPALPHNSQHYVTITTIPDVKHCSDCHYGPPDEITEDGLNDFGEVRRTRINCLRHGLTIHLAHDQVQPFPRFTPEILLRFKDSVVINTGNLFHIFTVKLVEPKETSPFRHELLTLPPDILPSPYGRGYRNNKKRHRHLRCDFWLRNCRNCSLALMAAREASRLVDTSDISLTEQAESENNRKVHAQELISAVLQDFGSHHYPPLPFLPTPRKRRFSQCSLDSEMSSTTTTSENSTASAMSWERGPPAPEFRFLLKTRLESAVEKMLPPDRDGRKFFKSLLRSKRPIPTSGAKPAVSPGAATLSAYDITEDPMIDKISFSSFRKKRLADKKYEFKDADLELSENIIPLKLSRRTSSSKIDLIGQPPVIVNLTNENNDNASPGFPRSPRGCQLTISPAMSPGQGEILRSITNTNSCLLPLMSPPRVLMADTSSFETLPKKRTAILQPGSASAFKNGRPNFSTNLNCIAKVLRCYTEDEDEALSVKTDTDDEYKQTLPFPIALQLKVHGTAYRPMNVISNSKSGSCPTPVVEVLQRSLDIEVLCNEASGIMCLAADKYYSSCFDYDVAIVDVCQERGSITAVAYVLMTATSLRKHEKYASPNSRDQSPVPGLSDQKQKYEAMFSFIWEPIEERCRILHMGNLKEIPIVPKQWHPTKLLVTCIRNQLYDTPFAARPHKALTNDLAVKDWQSLDELTDYQGILTLYRDRRLRGRRNAGYFPSPAMSSESSQCGGGSATTSDDEETEDSWHF